MTLHIRTITPNHVITVSDRLLYTPAGYIELGDDRYKHLVLICDDARVAVSFAGIAGIPKPNNNGNLDLHEGTINWLTEVIQKTSKNAHGINQHINEIRNQVQDRIVFLMGKYHLPWSVAKLAIQICGWIGDEQFDCVVDNCLDNQWQAGKTRKSFKTRHRTYRNDSFEDGSWISFLGQKNLAEQQGSLCDNLTQVARREDPKAIFDASVAIIRAAAVKSNGSIGYNCSGIRISRNDPYIQALDDRDETIWDTVMPNIIISTSRISASTTNMRGRKK